MTDPGPVPEPRALAVDPSGSRAGDHAALVRVRKVARLMDDAVEIPVVGVRVGLDAVLGLIPGGGDVAAAAVGGWIVVTAARLGAPASVVGRMLLNVVLDALLGAVPLAGDLFDVVFRANRRNLRLLEAHVSDPERTRRRSRAVVAGAVAAVLGTLAGVAAVLAWGLAAAWRVLAG